MRLDLTINQKSRVEKTKVGPFGSKLFDSAASQFLLVQYNVSNPLIVHYSWNINFPPLIVHYTPEMSNFRAHVA